MNIRAPNVEVSYMAPKTQNTDFLKKSCNTFDYISIIYGNCLPKWSCLGGIFGRIMVRAQRNQTWKVNFLKIGFTSRTNFIVVRYKQQSISFKKWRSQGQYIRKYVLAFAVMFYLRLWNLACHSAIKTWIMTKWWGKYLDLRKTKLRGFSPQANYTDRATAACRRS
jgi:hypothetical protein